METAEPMRIFNTLSGEKEEFTTPDGKVGMYVCGPTVYDMPHLGHARVELVFDVVRRWLEYRRFDVTYVQNITDVDDKIIRRASEQGISEKELAEKYTKVFFADCKKLGVKPSTSYPKATEHIPEMIALVQKLLENGHAYVIESAGVYYDISKFAEYGKLSHQSTEQLKAGARVEVEERKHNPLDFALWKSAKPDEPSWDSPWGKGRPGWHIECSVMSSNILGDEFDIHGGGIDLIFPHHENEIAQSEVAGKKFARYWIHNGLLTINKEKMAKSLGNFISIEDILSKYPSDVLKILFLQTHYSHPVDFSWEKMDEAKKAQDRFYILFDKLNRDKRQGTPYHKGTGQARDKENESAQKEINAFKEKFEKAMDDDFNTAEALAVLFDLVTCINKNFSELYLAKDTLIELGKVLGLFESGKISGNSIDSSEKSEIENLINLRIAARKNKDFKEADKIRKELEEKGIILEETKEGTTWRMK